MKNLRIILLFAFIPLCGYSVSDILPNTNRQFLLGEIKNFGIKDTIVPTKDDTVTVLVFSPQNIMALKKQLPPDVFENLGIRDEIDGRTFKYKNVMFAFMEMSQGKAKADNYEAIIKANSRETTAAVIYKEKADFILSAIDTGKLMGDPVYSVRLISIPNVPQTLKSIFKNYPLFYIISTSSRGGVKPSIGSIYQGEICYASRLINIAYNSVKEHTHFSIEERFAALLILLNGIDAQITITSVDKLSDPRFTHKIGVTINGESYNYRVEFNYDAIITIQLLSNTNVPVWGLSFNS